MIRPPQQNPDSSLSDIQIANPQQQPQDTVTDIQFSPQDPSLFACSTWDGKIHIYRVQVSQGYMGVQGQITQMALIQYTEAITTISWRSDGQAIYGGCGDNSVRVFNIQTGQSQPIGQHSAGIRSVFFVQQLNNCVISCSFDCTICFWSESSPGNPLAKIQTKGKIFSADCQFPVLAIAVQGEQIAFINLQQQNIQQLNPNSINYIESPLGKGSQINCIKLFTKINGFGLGSIDGRSNLGKLMPQQNSTTFKTDNIMTFKCHKTEEKQVANVNQILYPVNALSFNARSDNFLLTCGSDGNMYFWDFELKNKIKSFSFNKQPISACNTSSNGQFIAYALGYDWHLGYEYSASFDKPRVCVHCVTDDELKFKKQ